MRIPQSGVEGFEVDRDYMKLRYSLLSLLLLLIPAAFAANYARDFFIPTDIKWQEFDIEKIERNIAQGKKTFVYYHAFWLMQDKQVFSEFNSQANIGRLLNKNHVDCMRLNLEYEDDDVLRKTKYIAPCALVYVDDIEKPIRLDTWTEPKKVLSSLRKALR